MVIWPGMSTPSTLMSGRGSGPMVPDPRSARYQGQPPRPWARPGRTGVHQKSGGVPGGTPARTRSLLEADFQSGNVYDPIVTPAGGTAVSGGAARPLPIPSPAHDPPRLIGTSDAPLILAMRTDHDHAVRATPPHPRLTSVAPTHLSRPKSVSPTAHPEVPRNLIRSHARRAPTTPATRVQTSRSAYPAAPRWSSRRPDK